MGQEQPTAIPTLATNAGATTQSTNQAAGKAANPTSAKPAGQARPDANSRDGNSLASQPHAVALGYGWFVIQL
jgi:hypothetical protein